MTCVSVQLSGLPLSGLPLWGLKFVNCNFANGMIIRGDEIVELIYQYCSNIPINFELPTLHTLCLRGCVLGVADINSTLFKTSHLTSLSIISEDLSYGGDLRLHHLTSLRKLELVDCKIRSLISLSALTKLTDLSLDGSFYTGGTQQLTHLTRLRTLNLSKLRVELICLTHMTNLSTLHLDNSWPDNLSLLLRLTSLTNVSVRGTDSPSILRTITRRYNSATYPSLFARFIAHMGLRQLPDVPYVPDGEFCNVCKRDVPSPIVLVNIGRDIIKPFHLCSVYCLKRQQLRERALARM